MVEGDLRRRCKASTYMYVELVLFDISGCRHEGEVIVGWWLVSG